MLSQQQDFFDCVAYINPWEGPKGDSIGMELPSISELYAEFETDSESEFHYVRLCTQIIL